MWHFSKLVFVTVCILTLPACKLIYKSEQKVDLSANLTDAERMAAYVSEHWDKKFLPFFVENSHPFPEVVEAIAKNNDALNKKYGLRPLGEANPWSYIVKGTGTILSAKTKSKAAKAEVDVSGDGKADFTLQIGPIIRGTSLRDAAVFLKFSDFRDQIEYAKLGRALNARVHADTLKNLPMDSLVGTRISFIAGFTVRKAGQKLVLTPIKVGLKK